MRDQENIEKGIEQGMKQGRIEGIQGTIIALRDLGQKNSEIKTTIMEIYALSEDEAAEYLS